MTSTATLSTLRRSPVATAVHSQLPRAPKADWSKRRGKHTRPIEAIQLGDLVWAWDEVQSEHVRRPVVRLFRHQGKPIVAVTVVGDDGTEQRIESTTEHPFWVEGKGWVAACRLQAGDLLKRIAGGGDGLQVASAVLTGTAADVYNFEVSGVHNYFVGPQGVLVHNESNGASTNTATTAVGNFFGGQETRDGYGRAVQAALSSPGSPSDRAAVFAEQAGTIPGFNIAHRNGKFGENVFVGIGPVLLFAENGVYRGSKPHLTELPDGTVYADRSKMTKLASFVPERASTPHPDSLDTEVDAMAPTLRPDQLAAAGVGTKSAQPAAWPPVPAMVPEAFRGAMLASDGVPDHATIPLGTVQGFDVRSPTAIDGDAAAVGARAESAGGKRIFYVNPNGDAQPVRFDNDGWSADGGIRTHILNIATDEWLVQNPGRSITVAAGIHGLITSTKVPTGQRGVPEPVAYTTLVRLKYGGGTFSDMGPTKYEMAEPSRVRVVNAATVDGMDALKSARQKGQDGVGLGWCYSTFWNGE